MKEREEAIIDAAIRLFMRYGVKRTGMNDIAAEAGIARQTLYNAYPNKEAVLQATIRLMADRAIASIEKGLQRADNLSDQLDVVFRHIAIEHFELLDASPNSEDIVAGFNASSQHELAAAAERNKQILSALVKPFAGEIEKSGLTIDQFADFVERSATGAKYSATSRKHLTNMLAALKVAVLKVTGSG